jgi:hypothetical protein
MITAANLTLSFPQAGSTILNLGGAFDDASDKKLSPSRQHPKVLRPHSSSSESDSDSSGTSETGVMPSDTNKRHKAEPLVTNEVLELWKQQQMRLQHEKQQQNAQLQQRPKDQVPDRLEQQHFQQQAQQPTQSYVPQFEQQRQPEGPRIFPNAPRSLSTLAAAANFTGSSPFRVWSVATLCP